MLRESLDFRRFWIGETVSLVGDQVSLLALPLVGVLVLRATPAQMGYLAAFGLLPNLVFSLHLGAWVDRYGRRRRLMIWADAGRAALLLSIPAAYLAGHLGFIQLYVVAFLVGTLGVLFQVAYGTLFVSLVPREKYLEANSLVNGSRAMSQVAGPSLGGLLVQALSGPVAIAVDALSFVASAVSLSGIKAEEPAPATDADGGVMTGLRFIARTPVMRAALGATTTINFFNFVFAALFILYASSTLHIPAGLLGLVLGAGAVGGLLGAAVTGRASRRLGIGPTFALGCLLFPAPFLLIPLASGPMALVLSFLFAAEFLSGVGVMMLDIASGAIFSALTPDALRSRVRGAYMVVNFGVRPLGALVGGALGTAIGTRNTLWAAAVGGILGVLFLLTPSILRLHDLPDEAAVA